MYIYQYNIEQSRKIYHLYVFKKLECLYVIEMIDSILENFRFFKKLLLNLKSELGFYYTYKSIRSFYLRKHNEYNH